MPGRPGMYGPPGHGYPGAILARLKAADKNHDGKISKDEAPGRLAQAFEKLDGNKDGQLDRGEVAKMAQAFRAHAAVKPPEKARAPHAEKKGPELKKHIDKKSPEPKKHIDKKVEEKKAEKKN